MKWFPKFIHLFMHPTQGKLYYLIQVTPTQGKLPPIQVTATQGKLPPNTGNPYTR